MKINQLRPDLMGVNINLQVFPYCTSAGRLYMMGNHIAKATITKGRTTRKLVTGFERQYAKSSRNIVAPADMTVETVLFQKSIDNPDVADDWTEIYIVYFNEEQQQYDLLVLPKHHTQNTYIAYEYTYDKEMLRMLKPGATFGKGTVFANSPTISDTGEWMFGLDTMVCGMSHHSTEEDGVIMTESYAERLRCTFSHNRHFNWNEEDYIPLNLYGDKNNYQPFPNPGQTIRPDGIVIGFRKRRAGTGLVGLSKKALMRPDHIYDTLLFADPNCECKTIEVKSERNKKKANNRGVEKYTATHTAFLEQYESANNHLHNEVKGWYLSTVRKFGNGEVPLTPSLQGFIFKSYGNINKDFNNNSKYNQLKRSFKNVPLKDWNVSITLKESVVGKVRFKLTGTSGDKSVIVRKIPDHEAPVDDYGRRAELIINNTPAFRRQIFSALMEASINFVNLQVQDEVKSIMRDTGDYKACWDSLYKFYNTISPEFVELLDNAGYPTDPLLQIAHVDYILVEHISVLKRSDSSLYGADIIRKLKSVYGDKKPTPVTYVDDLGNTIRTNNPVIISSMYYLLLDKFGTDMSTQGLPRLSLFGTPAKINKNQKYKAFHRDTGNRNTGETEGRIEVSQKGGNETIKLLAGANSSVLSKLMEKRIIRADDPFNIRMIIKPEEYGTNRSLQMGIGMLNDSGYSLRRENKDDLN